MSIIVIKSNNTEQKFDFSKLRTSILKSFESVNKSPDNLEDIMDSLKLKIDDFLQEWKISTKDIWDLLEKTFIELNEYEVAKSYILYRWKTHLKSESKTNQEDMLVVKSDSSEEKFQMKKIESIFKRVSEDLPECTWNEFQEEFKKYLIPKISSEQIHKLLVKSAVDKISVENISWQKVAWRLSLLSLYKQASRNLNISIESLYSKENFLKHFNNYIEKKLYFSDFKRFYSDSDILLLAEQLIPERDYDYGYTTVLMYARRYLLNPNNIVKELPQHMYMVSAMFLAIPEWLDALSDDFVDTLSESDRKILKNPNKNLDDIMQLSDDLLMSAELRARRFEAASKIYNYTSWWEISLPTPTLLNSRTNFHQLSSCFKFNIEDDLRAIYHAVENMAQISKYGGWVGSYLWHIRARGSSIRWVKGASGGVLPWIKVINDTAIAVNQLWARAWAISVTLDIWHLDVLDFLEIQTETWDIRRKSFDVFPALAIPDLFMKRVIEWWKWTLFDPRESRELLWRNLENSYWEEFERLYEELEKHPNVTLKEEISAKDLFKEFLRTVVETGMPYVFFRDTSNRYNPNKHAWMVYSTQLCTEIIQNTSSSSFIEEEHENWVVNVKYNPWETVVCNLASINVAKVNPKFNNIEDVHDTCMRLLDNVITMNFYPVKETELTAMKYRPVWVWYMWVAEYLATIAKIRYDSPEASELIDKLFEQYAYSSLKASANLAKERGAYKLFDWSDRARWVLFWKDKSWFRGNSEHAQEWEELIDNIQKYWTRFGYHQSPAPNTSTALVVWTTAWVLPVYKKYFVETNAAAPTVNVAPNLSKENFWFYKEYVHMNMLSVIDVISRMQKRIDQSISFEWIINPMEVSPADLYSYYIHAWKSELKSIYYVRSMSLEVDTCESCAG